MYTKTLLAAGLVGLASAQSFTPPGAQTFGSLFTPDVSHPVTQGQNFLVTWDPTGHTTDGSTVSLVLCRGGGGNCVTDKVAQASGIPAKNAQYTWSVPCSLPVGTQSTATGYGMLIIVDGTGQFQYSTQFSVLAGSSCGSSSNSTTTTTTKSTTSSPKTTTTTMSNTWMGYNMTTTPVYTTKPAPQSTTVQVQTTAAVTVPTASAKPTVYTGAASQIGASAAALLMAAGAAFFAL